MITCKECDGKCCKYIAIEVDEPEDREDFDQMIWQLCHEGISIYIDNDNDWIVEVKTNCKYLDENNSCKIHEKVLDPNNENPIKEPDFCKKHSMENCEMNGEGLPHKLLFSKPEDIIKYMELKGIKY